MTSLRGPAHLERNRYTFIDTYREGEGEIVQLDSDLWRDRSCVSLDQPSRACCVFCFFSRSQTFWFVFISFLLSFNQHVLTTEECHPFCRRLQNEISVLFQIGIFLIMFPQYLFFDNIKGANHASFLCVFFTFLS